MKTATKGVWQRVSRRRPCPVCHEATGCAVAGDPGQPDAAICLRVESGKPIGPAWLHVLNDAGPTWSPWRNELRRAVKLLENAP